MIHTMLSLGLAFLNFQAGPKDILQDPTFKKMGDMVGGQWTGTLDKLTISFTYRYAEDGKMIEGTGHVSQNGKVLANMNSRFGWDPQAKQTYYIDFHGHDTVYNGHVHLKGDKFVFDFVGLIGDKGHWISYATMPTKNDYQFEMYQEKGGKLVPVHMSGKLHRIQ